MSYEPIPPDGKPYPLADTTCQKCGRSGLPVLLVRPSVVDKRREDALATVTRLYDQTLDADFQRMPRKGTVPVTRLLREGYVYVYYQARGVWDVWRVFADATYKKLLEHATAAQYAGEADSLASDDAEFVCSRGAANVPANLITLIGAQNQPAIWIAYADHLWTPEVLQRYAASDSEARPQRMTRVDGVALIKQGEKPPKSTFLSAPTLQAFVPEFSPAMPAAGAARHPALGVFERCDPPLASVHFSLAQPLDAAARAMEETAGPDASRKSLMLMVHDPVGVAQDYNVVRLGINDERQNWMVGGVDASGGNADALRPWKRQSLMLASYVREAVRQNARKKAEDMYNSGALKGSITISEYEYERVRADEAAGKPRYPAGTTYERLNTVPVVYRVTWSREAVETGLEGVAQADAQPRVARYDGHLDDAKIEQERSAWDAQQAAWTALQEARDDDYVAWLQSEVLRTTLRHDYDNRRFLEDELRDARKRDADMRDATARLEALARCYGGGICGDASRKHMIEMIAKDEGDPDNFFAATIIAPLGLMEAILSDPVSQASLYGVVAGSAQKADQEWRAGWAIVRDRALPELGVALLITNQVTQEMRRLLEFPDEARRLGVQSQIALAQSKQGVWVRAAALADFLDSGQRRYVLGIIAENLSVREGGGPVTLGRVEPAPDSPGGRRADRASDRGRRARVTLGARGLQALENSTVYLVFDEAQLNERSPSGRSVAIASHDLMGRPTTVRVPADLAEGLLRDAPMSFSRRMSDSLGQVFTRDARLPSLAAVTMLMLQSRALMRTIDDARQSGGLQRLEATAALLSATTGIAGALVEVAAIMLARKVTASGGLPPAGMLAGKLSWSVRLRVAGGFLAGAGAIFDGASAFFKFARLDKKGDEGAAPAVFMQGLVQTTGGVFLLLGSFIYLSVARSLAAGGVAQGVVAVMGGLSVAGAAAAWLTAGGIFLWIAGVGISILVLHLADDACEIWLDRSYFGVHKREEGAFAEMAQEVEAFKALAQGIVVQSEWDKAWFGHDEVRATIILGPSTDSAANGTAGPRAECAAELRYVLEGYKDRYQSAAVGVLASGSKPLPPDRSAGLNVEVRAEVADPVIGEARLTYTLIDGGEPIAGDRIWISK